MPFWKYGNLLNTFGGPETTSFGNIRAGTLVSAEMIMAGNAAILRSSDFDDASNGWQLKGDGSAKFSEITGLPWKVWTPTYANLTIGNGTVVARYVQIGSLVVARFEWTWGSTSSWDSTAATITLPIAMHASGYTDTNPIGVANFRDTGTNSFVGWAEVSSGNVALRVQNASGTYTTMSAPSSTVPMTWTTNDILAWTVTYEAA